MSVEWEVRGLDYANCNCAYGCPCQFNALPTDGTCKALGLLHIEKGHFGDVSLDGLNVGFLIDFPNPIHEGNGTHQAILDERADSAQRDALLTIVRGDETDELATHFYVYSKMSTTHLDPLVAPIEFDMNLDKRTARVKIGDLVESTCGPILNPVTGSEHRARIDLPAGFEYRLAEMGSASTTSRAGVQLDLKDSYGQLAHIHLSHAGHVN
jgi:hypothetical protein